MSELKRTQLYDVHVAAGAEMVDFGGWEMPIQYPSGIIAEHLYTRQVCSMFDVSHMGRLLIEGPDRRKFLQHVLTSNVAALDVNLAQYCIIPNENGGAVDDAYLYMFEEDNYLLVVNAANTEKDLVHLRKALEGFDCTITDISKGWAAIAVQGPKSKEMLTALNGGAQLTEPMKNALGSVSLEGHYARVAKTGYTGEPLGYEVYVHSEDAEWLWNRLVELGARPAGLGARDTLRLEAALPLYGHEMGNAPDGSEIPIFAVPLSKFAVSFAAEKGDFIGRKALEKQHSYFVKYMDRDFSDMSGLPRKIAPIALLDRGVMRAGMEIYQGDKLVGWVTSGTMVPYFKTEGEGLSTVILEASGKRAVGLCYIDNDILEDDTVEVDVRGKRLKAVIPARHMSVGAPPFARPLLYGEEEDAHGVGSGDRAPKALELLKKALENHEWRQEQCINLIPSENTPSRAVRLLSGSETGMEFRMTRLAAGFDLTSDQGRIDYAALAKQVAKVRPKLIVAGASAYPRAIDFEKLAEIAHGYGAMLMVDMAHIAGLVAGGQHQSPVPYADVVTTTTHKTLRGPRGGLILTNNEYIIKRINSAIFPGTQGGPLEHVIAAKAVCFGEALKPEFKEYARKIVENAKALEAELTARGVKLVSGGTDNHLLLIDLTDEDCTGKELEHNLDEVHITANKNTVPGEKRSPFVTSGVRIGTPAVTTRGMGPDEMKVIADCIADCVFDFANKKDEVARKVEELTKKFPLYE